VSSDGGIVVAGEALVDLVVDRDGLAWWRLNGLAAADVRSLDTVLWATELACAAAARTCERAGASAPRLEDLR